MIQAGPAACLIRKNVLGPESEGDGRLGRSCDINARDPMTSSWGAILKELGP